MPRRRTTRTLRSRDAHSHVALSWLSSSCFINLLDTTALDLVVVVASTAIVSPHRFSHSNLLLLLLLNDPKISLALSHISSCYYYCSLICSVFSSSTTPGVFLQTISHCTTSSPQAQAIRSMHQSLKLFCRIPSFVSLLALAHASLVLSSWLVSPLSSSFDQSLLAACYASPRLHLTAS